MKIEIEIKIPKVIELLDKDGKPEPDEVIKNYIHKLETEIIENIEKDLTYAIEEMIFDNSELYIEDCDELKDYGIEINVKTKID